VGLRHGVREAARVRRTYTFDPEHEEYLVHVTTGTHVAQICLFLLTETRYIPARLIQTAPPRRHDSTKPGSFSIIDLDCRNTIGSPHVSNNSSGRTSRF
jgi:sigma54-dependent transcription regulator